MKFVLFVEGHTEQKAVPAFLKRWLDPQLPAPVGIQCVRFEGWADLVKEAPKKAKLYLARRDVIAVIALLDLYGPTFYPEGKRKVQERFFWAKQHLEGNVGEERFFQFFAVHEVEAWLFSDPAIFPSSVRGDVQIFSEFPEQINGIAPPSKKLNEIYSKHVRKRYKKVVYGKDLFKKLDPHVAYKKCPYLKAFLDAMLQLGRGTP